MTDARTSQRKTVTIPAWVELKGGLLPCSVSNISESGAQICIPQNPSLPARFPLRLHEDGKVRRGCRVIWQKEDRIGVRFFPLTELA
ncbi:MAG: PilZ domain-containing protein [Pseudolabrys sp.]|nr:PilZ domain-containing protein [Pseudolabrys sp.]